MNEEKKSDWLKVAVAVLVAVIGLFLLLFLSGTGGGMMSGLMGGMMGFGWLIMLSPVILVIVLIFFLLNRGEVSRGAPAYSDPGENGSPEDPLEILDRRYARGEISNEEYHRIRDDLGR